MNFIIYQHLTTHTLICNISKDKFITHNPPCKECLVQGICIIEFFSSIEPITEEKEIELNKCEKLIKFLKENKTFVTSKQLTKKS